MNKAEGAIAALEPLSASVLWCRVATATPLHYQPGQYCMVAVGTTARAYSFATLPGAPSTEWLIDTRPNGPASRFFRQAHVGAPLSFTYPYGDFVVDPDASRPLLYIAGGTGLAPIMAHLSWLTEQKSRRLIKLIVGHRSADEVFWHDKLQQLAATHQFSYQMYIGPFLDKLAEIKNLPEHTAYICGGAAMCTATAERLYQLGASPANVHYELFT